jgi:hypothetical protein
VVQGASGEDGRSCGASSSELLPWMWGENSRLQVRQPGQAASVLGVSRLRRAGHLRNPWDGKARLGERRGSAGELRNTTTALSWAGEGPRESAGVAGGSPRCELPKVTRSSRAIARSAESAPEGEFTPSRIFTVESWATPPGKPVIAQSGFWTGSQASSSSIHASSSAGSSPGRTRGPGQGRSYKSLILQGLLAMPCGRQRVGKGWYRGAGSNRRPPDPQSGALTN